MKKIFALSLSMLFGAANADTFYNFEGMQFVEGRWQCFNWMRVDEGRISQTGRGELKLNESETAHDLRGAFVLPGLIDAHGHVFNYGQEQRQIDLRGSQSIDEVIQRVKSFHEKHPDANWILGRGWNQVLWTSKTFPSAKDLDAHFPHTPVMLERVDGHAIWVNSAAMKTAKISRDSISPLGGEIIKNADGAPTGVFIDNASSLITNTIPELSQKERAETLAEAMNGLASLGLTGVHDAGISLDDYRAYQKLGQNKALPIRVYAMLADSKETRAHIQQPPLNAEFDQRLTVKSIKAWADGALGSRGAALRADYSDKPGHKGLMLYQEEDLSGLVKSAINNGWQVNVHAIGDAGNHLMLNLFEQHSRDGKARSLRHRIEHAQVISLEDIPRFAALDVIASIQPTHATSDMNMAEDRIGKERLKGAYAWRKLLDAKVKIASGSDFPVELANPFHGLYAAITRKDRDGNPVEGWYPDQKLTREEALSSFTIDAAYAAHMEHDVGALSKGQWADFIVVNEHFFSLDEDKIDDIQVLQTVVAGKSVYARH